MQGDKYKLESSNRLVAASPTADKDTSMDFDWDAHAGNFLRSLAHPGLPAQYLRADTQRVRFDT